MFAQSKVSLNPPHIWHKYYRFPLILLILACLVWAGSNGYAQDEADELTIEVFPVPARSRPNGIAPAPNGTVWYTAQALGELGVLDPETGDTYHIPLGRFSTPFSVITGPDGAAWITDGGLNAIVRVDGETEEVTVYPLPEDAPATRLNSAVFQQ
jgi:virginiamycin B lyase